MRLLEDVHYIAGDGRNWPALKGSTINGASIPKAFWCTVGGPYEGAYREASVFHDIACDEKKARWQDVHRMFYTGMRCSGVSESKSKVMYTAVYRFGPRWPEPGTARSSARMAAFLPARQPTEAEAHAVEEWVERRNPSLEEIERTTAIPGAPGP
ncbi:DUF1353 domain-containing protein [Roseimicrobium gellanilyticum]|nr:DUF1353 domain-containing protein [Roseimicrobium gellanilyticum]